MILNFSFIPLTFFIFCDARVEKMMNRPIIADLKVHKHHDVTGLEPVTHLIQIQCNISNIDTIDIVPGAWMLVKVTPFPPPNGFDHYINFCSTFCYNPGICEGVRVIIQKNDDDQTMTFDTYSKSRLLKNMVHFQTSVMKVDVFHAIYQGHLKLMETLTESGKFDDIDSAPPIIIKTQNVPFVKIASSMQGMWMIFKTCDEHEHTWVLLSREALDNQDTYAKSKNEYDQSLTSLYGVDAENMVDIPLSDYF